MVARQGGFSRAAEALGLTQPAVSDQVRKLEQDYDLLLFNRHRKQVTLTAEGQDLLAVALPMFEQEARVLEFLTEQRALTEGTLRVIADSAYHVTGVLARFRDRYPAVRVVLRAGNSNDVIDALGAYRADIGVLGSVENRADLTEVTLGASPIIAFSKAGYGGLVQKNVTFSEIVKLPLILREPGSKTRQKLDDAARQIGVTLSPAIEAEGREAVREIVASGAGIGFVSEAEYGHDTRLWKIRLPDLVAQMEETVVCISRRKDVRTIRAFMAMARETSAPHA